MPAGITAVPAGIPNVPAGLYDCELKFMLEIEIHTTKSYVCRNEEEEGVEDESKVRGGRHAWVYDRVETGLSGIKLFHSTTKRIAFFDKILVQQEKLFPGAGAELESSRSVRSAIITKFSLQEQHFGP